MKQPPLPHNPQQHETRHTTALKRRDKKTRHQSTLREREKEKP